MLRASFQRAAMAILLMGMMIAPLGICLQLSPNGAHSCCMQSESSRVLHTNCCVFRTQLPAIVAAPALPDASPNTLAHEYSALEKAKASDQHTAIVLSPPLTSPTGAFILRI
jgi:hypothetical protein